MDWTQLITQVGPLGAIALFVLMRLEKAVMGVRDEVASMRVEVAKLAGKMDARSGRAPERADDDQRQSA